jgi:hypothetical protein
MEESSLKEWYFWDELLAAKGSFSGWLIEVENFSFRERGIIREIALRDCRVIISCQSSMMHLSGEGDQANWCEIKEPREYSHDHLAFEIFEDPSGNIILDSGNFFGIIKYPIPD